MTILLHLSATWKPFWVKESIIKEKWDHLDERAQFHSLKQYTILNANAGTYRYLSMHMYSTPEIYFPNSIPWIGMKAPVYWLLSNAASEKHRLSLGIYLFIFQVQHCHLQDMKWQDSTTLWKMCLQSKLEVTEAENVCVQNQFCLIILPGTALLQVTS